MSELAYNPNPSAVAVHNSESQIKCIVGPVGSGKTTVACWEFLLRCLDSPVPLRGVVIRESYRELHDSTRQTFEEWFENLDGYHYREKDEVATLALTGTDGVLREHSLFFRACRRESDASKFLSTEFGFIWLEEVVPAYSNKGVMGQGLPKGVFDVALMRLRQKGARRLTVLVTCNPPPTRHWVYDDFFKQTPETLARKHYGLFRQPAFENKHNLREGYYEDLEERLSPELARRFVRGEVVTLYEGVRVFPEAKDNYHIVDHVEAIPNLPLTLGQDYGLRPACLITQIVPGGQWRWLREVQMFNTGVRRFVEHLVPVLKQEFPGFEIGVMWQDPTGGNQRSQVDENETCASIMRAAGFTVQDGNNNWTLRKETVKQRFETAPGGEPGVLISRYGCPTASEGLLGAYRYPKSSEGFVGSMPIKNEFSDLQDCAQMIAVGEFSVLAGLAKIEATAKKQRIVPVHNPLASNRASARSSHAWMAR